MTGTDDAVLGVCGDHSNQIAVGGNFGVGAAFSLENQRWRQAELPAGTGLLWWCHQTAAGDVFAAGQGATIIRRNMDGVWTDTGVRDLVPAGTTFFGVWGSASRVIAVGGDLDPSKPGVVAILDGTEWSIVDTDGFPPGTLFKVWGASASDIWAVGDGGTTVHFDGEAWKPVSSGTSATLIAVFGSGPSDVFAVGGRASGIILRWDGARWSQFAETATPLSGVWTKAEQPLFVSGERGYVARFRRKGGRVVPTGPLEALADPTLDLHALFSVGTEFELLIAAADLLGGGANGFRGTVLARSTGYDGEVVFSPDAGIAEPDAGEHDAGVEPGLGPGEVCDSGSCRAGLSCFGLWMDSDVQICTEPCADADQCGMYGDNACCARPGLQTALNVCIPGNYAECDLDP